MRTHEIRREDEKEKERKKEREREKERGERTKIYHGKHGKAEELPVA